MLLTWDVPLHHGSGNCRGTEPPGKGGGLTLDRLIEVPAVTKVVANQRQVWGRDSVPQVAHTWPSRQNWCPSPIFYQLNPGEVQECAQVHAHH